MKKKIPLFLVIAAVAFAAWKISHQQEFLYAGTVEATYVDLSPQVTTTIGSVEVREGDPVKNVQDLVHMTGDDIKLAADIAERDFQRALKLRNSGSMPQESFDRIRFRRDDAVLRSSWCVIKSPLDGTVIDRYHEPGELVNPSMKLLTLADLDHVYAYIYVPQTMLAHVQLDQKLEGLLPELDMKRMEGRITHIRDQAEFTPKNVQTREERTRLVYGIKVSFDNPGHVLKPGMTVEVKLPEK